MNTIILLLINVLLLVTGQITWKIGVSKIGNIGLANLFELLTSVQVWIGIALFGIATIVWLVLLSRENLSTIYPMGSIAYVLGMVGGILFFGEKVSAYGWVGALFIIVGVFLTSTGIK